MEPLNAQSTALPAFERPSEAVVFWTLENLCRGAGGRYMLPMRKLARLCGISVNTTHRAIRVLAKRGLIVYRRGYNQSRPSIFEISTGGKADTGANLSAEVTARPKIGTPPPIDTISDLSLRYLYLNDIREVAHRQNGDSVPRDLAGRFAYRIAEGLDDLKNLPLYKNYCQKFPAGMILNAFHRAKETPLNKIKTSRGALFNFLVQLYAKRRNHNDNPGD